MTDFDIGIEKEYALVAEAHGRVGYYLGMEVLIEALNDTRALPPELREEIEALRNGGWRVEPEYSRCLVEVVSPPFGSKDKSSLLAGYQAFEESFRHATNWVFENSAPAISALRFGDEYGSITNAFINERGELTEDWNSILLSSGKSKNIVELARQRLAEIPKEHGSPEAAARIFAGFTSTHVTVRRFGFYDDCGSKISIEQDVALALWCTLRVAIEADRSRQADNIFYPNGEFPVKLDSSPREVFLKWMDHLGNRMKAEALGSAGEDPDAAVALFREIYGTGPFTDNFFDDKRFRNYACRPRLINGNLMFEFRNFDGATDAENAFHTAEAIVREWPICSK